MNLPNKLTMGRIIAVPFFIVCYILGYYIPALVLFCAASLTDMLDGKIARKYHLVTNFGKIMDPLADKILVYSAFCLMIGDRTIAGMRTVAASEGTVIAAAMSGKIKTVLQMFAVIMLMLFHGVPETSGLYTPVRLIAYALLWASIIMTVYSGIEYVVKNIRVFRESE